MKKTIVFLAAGLLLAACQRPDSSLSGESKENPIVIGHMENIHSEILDESRNIWVHVPDDANGGIYGKSDYPVVYLLDAPDHFHALTGVLHNLGNNGIVPKMVVVAIPNTDRTRDLTPSHVDVMFGDSAFVRTSGGGDKFLDFLENELIPYVEEKYPVTGYRTFVGHSFGGLAAVNALYQRPALFHNYISVDPSMWWDDWLLVKKAEEALDNPELSGRSLFVGVANTMEEGMEIDRVKEDTARSSDHIRSIINFIDKLDGQQDPYLNSAWKYYENDDHGSVPLITEYDAFRFLFSWYRLQGLQKFFLEDTPDEPEELLQVLEAHYEQVSERFGYPVPPAEPEVNSLGYNFMNRNKPAMARAMFELNLRNYPGSANVYDSMGDYYLNQEDTLQAIEQFEKALELGKSPYTREKLTRLKRD